MRPSRRNSLPAHVTTAEDLRWILRDDPEAFCDVLEDLIRRCTDDVTKDFWVNVKQFALREFR